VLTPSVCADQRWAELRQPTPDEREKAVTMLAAAAARAIEARSPAAAG